MHILFKNDSEFNLALCGALAQRERETVENEPQRVIEKLFIIENLYICLRNQAFLWGCNSVGEYHNGIVGVEGSNPFISTRRNPERTSLSGFFIY